jgi:hypothetical protein
MRDLSLIEARLDAGLSAFEAAAWLGRSLCTWRRWEREGAPDWVLPILHLRAGHLDLLGWPGWRLFRDRLYAPDLAYGWERGHLYSEWWNRQRLSALERRSRDAAALRERQGCTAYGRSECPLTDDTPCSVSNGP